MGVFWNPQDLLLMMGTEIFNFDASLAEKLTKTRVSFLTAPTVISINNLWSPRSVPMWMRVYSWHMVIVGVGGGILSFVNAVMSVKDKLQEGESCWTVWVDSDSG